MVATTSKAAGTSPGDDLGPVAEETIARGSKSFAAAARLFDPATRRSAMLLYAWCRHCDDVVDGQTLGFADAAPRSARSASQRLAELHEATEAALHGHPGREPAFRALAEVFARHPIPPVLAFEHLEGYRMDVEDRRYETIGDTLGYCYHVAGVVGVMMAIIMGVRDEAVLDRACDLGLAFQLTNIARDVIEDAQAGRVYLPADWLRQEAVDRDRVGDPRCRNEVATVARRLLAEAEPYYASAAQGLKALPWRSAWAIATALGVYREIGTVVDARGAAAWDTRVSTTTMSKLFHVAKGAGRASFSVRTAPISRSSGLWTRPRRMAASPASAPIIQSEFEFVPDSQR